MEKTGRGYSSILLLAFIPGVLASSTVEVVPSTNPARVGHTVTLALSPPTALRSGSWAMGDSLIITWQRGQQAVFPGHTGRASVDPATGALNLSSLTVPDSGLYVVLSSDPELKANVTITVLEPVAAVTLTLNITELLEFNSSVSLSCSSSGSSLSYLWLNGSSEVPASEGVQLGDGGSTLTIVSVTRYDQGPFRCNVSNAISDAVSQPLNLTINYGPDSMVLTVKGQNTSFFITGTNLTMLCSAQSSPHAQIQWAFKGEFLNETGPELELYGVREDQSGPYSCLAFNNKTNMNSNITKHITIADTPLSGSEHLRVCVWLLPFLSLAGVLLTLSGLF